MTIPFRSRQSTAVAPFPENNVDPTENQQQNAVFDHRCATRIPEECDEQSRLVPEVALQIDPNSSNGEETPASADKKNSNDP
jgi:hypothetical protein